VSSVYLWDLEDGFAGVVCLKKGESRRHLRLTRFERCANVDTL
jgi:hypothetical protein